MSWMAPDKEVIEKGMVRFGICKSTLIYVTCMAVSALATYGALSLVNWLLKILN